MSGLLAGLGNGRERARVEGVTAGRHRTAGEFALEVRDLILEFGDTDRLTISQPFGTIGWSNSSSSVVTHVSGSISAQRQTHG